MSIFPSFSLDLSLSLWPTQRREAFAFGAWPSATAGRHGARRMQMMEAIWLAARAPAGNDHPSPLASGGVALLGAPRGQSDSIELNFFFQISKRTTRTGFQSDSARLRVRATTHFDKFRAASAQIMALSVRPSDVICGRRADRDRDARCPSSAACKLFAACRPTDRLAARGFVAELRAGTCSAETSPWAAGGWRATTAAYKSSTV